MNSINSLLSRRALMPMLAVGTLAFLPRLSSAQSLEGFNPLATPAIPVRSPASVILIAITETPAHRLVAVGVHGVIIYSDDQGVSWTQARVPVNLSITCVAFATPQRGWAAGDCGVILATMDGGETWSKQLDGNEANQLTMAAAQDPTLHGSPCPCADVAMKRATIFMQAGADKPFLCMLVLSPQEVIVFGAYRLAMRTNDGGKTWADWSLHIYDRVSHNIYGAAAIGSNYFLVAEEGAAFVSTDQCNTFLPLDPTGNITQFGVLGAPDGSLIAYGVAGNLFRSTDAGSTWTQITLDFDDNVTSGCLLSSGQILLASAAGELMKSMDNGATFNAIPNIRPVSIFAIQQIANGSLITVGAGGVTTIPKNLLIS